MIVPPIFRSFGGSHHYLHSAGNSAGFSPFLVLLLFAVVTRNTIVYRTILHPNCVQETVSIIIELLKGVGQDCFLNTRLQGSFNHLSGKVTL